MEITIFAQDSFAQYFVCGILNSKSLLAKYSPVQGKDWTNGILNVDN